LEPFCCEKIQEPIRPYWTLLSLCFPVYYCSQCPGKLTTLVTCYGSATCVRTHTKNIFGGEVWVGGKDLGYTVYNYVQYTCKYHFSMLRYLERPTFKLTVIRHHPQRDRLTRWIWLLRCSSEFVTQKVYLSGYIGLIC
jgi:hypothetical protein